MLASLKYFSIRAILLRFISDHVSVSPRIRISNSVKFVSHEGKIKVDKGFHALRNVTIQVDGGEIIIGKNTFLNENVKIVSHKSIKIGENCSFGPNVVVYDHDHNYHCKNGGFVSSEIEIGNNVWIGANVVVLRGVHIGSDSVIAAGSIVKNDIPSGSLFYNGLTDNIKTISE